MSFSYRIQIKFPDDTRLECENSTYKIDGNGNFRPIRVDAFKQDNSISESSELVFKSDGFDNQKEAENEGDKVLNTLIRTFIHLKKGIDFGARGPSFHITPEGLKHFQKQFEVERMLEGGLGLKVYKTLPPPRFAQLNVSPTVFTPINKLEQTFEKAETKFKELNQKEFLSAQLFNSSYFEEIPESRFLLLVMAIEVLIECQPRSKNVEELIDELSELTKTNEKIDSSDKQSILGSLSWLKSDSIGQAGRKLAKKKLSDKKYNEMSADKFFTYIYGIRSNLVHGNKDLPTSKDLGSLSPELEKFVSDLLTTELNE